MIDTAETTTNSDTKTCYRCKVVLTDDTWYTSRRRVNIKECISCCKRNNTRSNPNNNPNRMWVNGKYIPKNHPLYKSGSYKTFGDAAFAALQRDSKVKQGYVYAICNTAWPGWIKIGKAVDAEDRLNSYQTSSPMRDYILIHSVYFDDRNAAEIKAHNAAQLKGQRKNEWFNITKEEALEVLQGVS